MFQETINVLQQRLSQGLIFVRNDPSIQESVSVDKIFKIETVDDKEIYPDVWTRLYFTVVGFTTSQLHQPTLNISIYCTRLKEEPIDESKIRIDRWSGFIKCMGEVSSHIFVHPKLTVGEMNHFVRTDIMRSVSGRLRFYLDAFPDMTSERKARLVCNALPPRRVYFAPFPDSNILFSDFIFNGEHVEQVLANAKQHLGLSIVKKSLRLRAEISECLRLL